MADRRQEVKNSQVAARPAAQVRTHLQPSAAAAAVYFPHHIMIDTYLDFIIVFTGIAYRTFLTITLHT